MNTITAKEIEILISNNENDLACRLMKSEFLTPVRIEKHSTVVSTVSDDENVFMRLFASLDDYRKLETEIEPMMIPFEMTFNALNDMIDGFIIYIDSREFILDEDFIERNLAPYTAEELKDIKDCLVADEENCIANSMFLTLLLLDSDYSTNASNGIIDASKGIVFDMATTEIDGKLYHLLFTSKSHMIRAFELFPGSHCYSQIIDLAELVRYLREENIEGVLIDFPDEFHYVPTAELVKLNIAENPKLRYCLDYAFEVE